MNVSNLLGYYTLTQTLRVISSVDNLLPGLVDSSGSYVSYLKTSGNGLAQFVFSYFGSTMAGSHSTVMFWPGDSRNTTFGPFPLSMDFIGNVSKTQLQYTYSQKGTYTACFFTTNPLGSRAFTFIVHVVDGMNGFYISVNPMFSLPGQPVTVSAYLVQGSS